jgi:tetratricopeptide (TPR) repeat protein
VSLATGDDLDRELRRAARTAAARTARELLPEEVSDSDSAIRSIVGGIERGFAEHSVGTSVEASPATLLEAVHTGISARMLPMGEVRLRGASAAPVVVSASAVSEELSRQLLREIVLRDARGGPLKPLADQLNADVTRLQGERTILPGEQATATLAGPVEAVAQALAYLDEANAGPRAMSTLPADVESFTGREAEVEQLMRALDHDDAAGGVIAIDTIDGMAGVGKTALAVHVAHMLAPRFSDGQLYVHLHGHTPDQPPVKPLYALSALLLETGFPPDRIPAGLDECAATWRGHMTNRKVLLLLDDAASAEQVRPLLPGTAGSRVLVTSRRRLPAIPAARSITIGVLTADHAASLFVRLTGREDLASDDPAVAEVVRLCGYLPLAISLMAAQLMHHRVWTPADLAAELSSAQSKLSLMVAEDTSVARAIDLSYRNLSPRLRRLLRQLSLCPGAEFDVFAAAALDAADPRATARRLNTLFECNLLRENSKGRYSFHDLIREYARSLAPGDSSWQARAARRRLFDYYLQCARAADRFLSRRNASGIPVAIARRPAAAPKIASWEHALAWMNAEHLNVYAAVRYAALNGWQDHAVAMPPAMSNYLRITGNWNEARELIGVALRVATASDSRMAEPVLLCDLGQLRYNAGDLDGAAETFTNALNLARGLNDPLGEANARLRLATVLTVRGALDEAAVNIDRAQLIGHNLKDPLAEALAAIYRGTMQYQSGQFEEAERNVAAALNLYRQLGIAHGEAEALGWLGGIQLETGRYEAAEANLSLARDIHRQCRDRVQEAGTIYFLGAVQRDAGKFDAAAENLRLALQMYIDAGDQFGQAGVLSQLGRLEVERAIQEPMRGSDQEHARAALTKALELYRSFDTKIGEAEVLNNLGRLTLSAGNTAEARPYLDQALALAEETGSTPEQARALEAIGMCQYESGERAQGVESLRLALAIYQEIKSPHAHRVVSLLSKQPSGEDVSGQPGES